MSNTAEYAPDSQRSVSDRRMLGVKVGWRAQSIFSEMLAEFLGCVVLIAFGAGVVAVAVVGLTESGRTAVIFNGAGGWLLITWGWAFAVTMAIWLFDVSSGMEDVEHGVDGRTEQVDDAREGSGVAIASGASAGCLEQPIERFEAGIGMA